MNTSLPNFICSSCLSRHTCSQIYDFEGRTLTVIDERMSIVKYSVKHGLLFLSPNGEIEKSWFSIGRSALLLDLRQEARFFRALLELSCIDLAVDRIVRP